MEINYEFISPFRRQRFSPERRLSASTGSPLRCLAIASIVFEPMSRGCCATSALSAVPALIFDRFGRGVVADDNQIRFAARFRRREERRARFRR
jgi:hypothetical protein